MKKGLLQGPGTLNLNETPRSNDPLFSIGLVISLLVVVLVLVPGSVEGVTITWTTTADFDTGTYTSSAGNREINSNSCNLGIAAGSFELDSLKGDSFCIADPDGDTFKWDPFAGIGCVFSIASGEYTIQDTNAGGTSCSSNTAITFTGDFDIRAKITLVSGADFPKISILNEDVVNWNSGTTVDGFLQEVVPSGVPEDDISFFEWTITNAGAAACVAGDRTITDRTITWIRLVLSAGTITFYDSADGVSWTTGDSCASAAAGPWYLQFQHVGNEIGSTQFDDFHLATFGSISAGGFRSSGSWTSATQTFDGTVASQITLAYSGSSAAGYIDAVRIVDSVGTTIFTDDTDRTSGSSVVVTVTYSADLQADWAIRVLLAGDGSATPTITSVTVDTALPPGGSEPPPRGFPGFAIDCRVEIGSVRCIVTLPATVGLRILQTQWYTDGSFRGYGIALDDSRQQISLGAPLALSIYRGSVNVTVLVLVSNGQEIRQSEILTVDNSWITFLLILGSVVGVCLVLLRMMGKLEIRRKKIEKRKGIREDNWRWQLFEKK